MSFFILFLFFSPNVVASLVFAVAKPPVSCSSLCNWAEFSSSYFFQTYVFTCIIILMYHNFCLCVLFVGSFVKTSGPELETTAP